MAPTSTATAASSMQPPMLRVNASNDPRTEVEHMPPQPRTEAGSKGLGPDGRKREDGGDQAVSADRRPYVSYPPMNSRAAPNVPDCQSYPPSSRHLDGAEAHCIRAKGATNSNRASRAEWRPLQPTNAANNDLAPRMKGERSLEEGSLILSICVTRKKLFSGEYTQICRHPKIDRLQNDKAVFELMRNVFEDCKPRWVKICRYIIPFVVTAVCLSTIKFSPGHADVWGTETNTPVSQKAKPRYLCIEVETDKPALDKNFLLSRFNNPKLCENTRSAWFYLPKRTKGLPQMPNPATGLEFLSVAADEHGVEIVTQVSKLGVFCSSALLVFGINALVVGWTGNIAWWAVGASVLTAIAAALGLWA